MAVATAEKTVTIKTLVVDNKRMTFSLLHQLPQADHMAGGTYAGRGDYRMAAGTEPWGYVVDGKEHWLLFTRDGKLYRHLISLTDTAYDQLFIA